MKHYCPQQQRRIPKRDTRRPVARAVHARPRPPFSTCPCSTSLNPLTPKVETDNWQMSLTSGERPDHCALERAVGRWQENGELSPGRAEATGNSNETLDFWRPPSWLTTGDPGIESAPRRPERPSSASCKILILLRKCRRWSGRVDSNHRPPGPEPGALARLSHAPTFQRGSLPNSL
jgi:hypothetical protein